jgi:hypothetical protein
VSSLYELSKAATEASSAAVDFYNASLTTNEEATHVFTELADSLKLLTQAANGVHASAKDIGTDAGIAAVADPALLSVGQVEAITAAAAVAPKKKKVEKDPYAPKKPLTVFFAYSAYVREAIRDERSSKGLTPLSSTEITQVISQKWNDMSEPEKQKWKEAYAMELASYQQEKEKYLEDKKNGLPVNTTVPTHAPVPVPSYLVGEKSKKRSSDSEKEKEKKKKKKKEKKKSLLPEEIAAAHASAF